MVNGPASGGEFPLGKEYWENQEDNKGYQYDSNKNAPKKAINVPVGQAQQGEAMQKLEKKFSEKEIARLLKKAKTEQKQVMMDHIDVIHPATDLIEKLITRIPPEDMANLKTQKDIINYIKNHPELKQSIELVDESAEEKPVIAEKLPLDGEEPAEPKPVIAEKLPLPPAGGKKQYVKPDMKPLEGTPKATPEETPKATPPAEPSEATEKEAEQEVVLDLTTQFEDGERVYYAKDPSRGEDGWYKIDKEKYDEIYNKYYKAKESPDSQNV